MAVTPSIDTIIKKSPSVEIGSFPGATKALLIIELIGTDPLTSFREAFQYPADFGFHSIKIWEV